MSWVESYIVFFFSEMCFYFRVFRQGFPLTTLRLYP